MTAPVEDPLATSTGAGTAVAEPRPRVGESPRRRFLRRFVRQRAALVGLAFLALVVLAAVLAPVLATHDPARQSLAERLQGPGGRHWLGTDDLGRDVLSRLLFACRVSLVAALQATVVSIVLGVPVGLVAGYVRGWFDTVASRVADAMLSIPALLLALAIIGVLGRNLTNAMLAIGIVNAPRFFRVVRSSALAVREETFIEAARTVGGTTGWVIRRHVLPNSLSPLVVQISLSMGFAILFEAGISFLGLGVQPPGSSWGTMLGRSTRFMEVSPHLVVIPGLAIFFTVLAFNVVGDGIRDSLGREIRRAR